MHSLLGELYLDQSVDPSSCLSSLQSSEPLGAISDWDRGYEDLIIDLKTTRWSDFFLCSRKSASVYFSFVFWFIVGDREHRWVLMFLYQRTIKTLHSCDFALVLTGGVQVIAIFQNVWKLEISWLWITHGMVVQHPDLKYCIQESNHGNVRLAKSMQVFSIMLYRLGPVSKMLIYGLGNLHISLCRHSVKWPKSHSAPFCFLQLEALPLP